MLTRIDCAVYIDVTDGADPEEVARDFDAGFFSSVANFDGFGDYNPEVVKGAVREINLVDEEEASEEGLTE